MINPIKHPAMIVFAGVLLLIVACLIALNHNHYWDNLTYGAAIVTGVLVVLWFFNTAIQRAKATYKQ